MRDPKQMKLGECGVYMAAALKDALADVGVFISLDTGDWNFLGGYLFSSARSIAQRHDQLKKEAGNAD